MYFHCNSSERQSLIVQAIHYSCSCMQPTGETPISHCPHPHTQYNPGYRISSNRRRGCYLFRCGNWCGIYSRAATIRGWRLFPSACYVGVAIPLIAVLEDCSIAVLEDCQQGLATARYCYTYIHLQSRYWYTMLRYLHSHCIYWCICCLPMITIYSWSRG